MRAFAFVTISRMASPIAASLPAGAWNMKPPVKVDFDPAFTEVDTTPPSLVCLSRKDALPRAGKRIRGKFGSPARMPGVYIGPDENELSAVKLGHRAGPPPMC